MSLRDDNIFFSRMIFLFIKYQLFMLVSDKFSFWWQYWFMSGKIVPLEWVIMNHILSHCLESREFRSLDDPAFSASFKSLRNIFQSNDSVWMSHTQFQNERELLEEIADTVRPWPKSDCTRNNDRRMQIMNNPRLLIKEIWTFGLHREFRFPGYKIKNRFIRHFTTLN